VEALVLEQAFDVQVAEARDEVWVDEHVDVAVFDHYSGSWDGFAELHVDAAQDAGEEGLVEHHPQDVRAEVTLILDSAIQVSHVLSPVSHLPEDMSIIPQF